MSAKTYTGKQNVVTSELYYVTSKQVDNDDAGIITVVFALNAIITDTDDIVYAATGVKNGKVQLDADTKVDTQELYISAVKTTVPVKEVVGANGFYTMSINDKGVYELTPKTQNVATNSDLEFAHVAGNSGSVKYVGMVNPDIDGIKAKSNDQFRCGVSTRALRIQQEDRVNSGPLSFGSVWSWDNPTSS